MTIGDNEIRAALKAKMDGLEQARKTANDAYLEAEREADEFEEYVRTRDRYTASSKTTEKARWAGVDATVKDYTGEPSPEPVVEEEPAR